MVWQNCDDLQCLGLIGKGSFGKVYHAFGSGEERHFAVKEITIKSGPHYTQLRQEIDILIKLNHPNVNRYFWSWSEGQSATGWLDQSSTSYSQFLYIKLELCTTNLRQFLGNKLPTQRAKWRERHTIQEQIIPQILSGLAYIHSQSVIHRDINPRNVFVCGDGDEVGMKIGDFGLAVKSDQESEEDEDQPVGQVWYQSPEMREGDFYDAKTDIFSVGLVFYEIVTEFQSDSRRWECFQQIQNGIHGYKELHGVVGFGTEVKEAIKRMTGKDPEQRLSAEEALAMIQAKSAQFSPGPSPPDKDDISIPVPAHVVKFIGRQAELERLHLLAESYAILGIFGTSGVGKSSLAKEFVRHQPNAVWLDATNRMKLRSSLLSLCSGYENNAKSLTQIFKCIINSARFDPSSNIVVVLDNYLDTFCPLKVNQTGKVTDNPVYSAQFWEKIRLATFHSKDVEREANIGDNLDHDHVPLLSDLENSTQDQGSVDYSVLPEEKEELARFVGNIASFRIREQRVIVVITTVSGSNLPDVAKPFKLEQLSLPDAIEMVASSFGCDQGKNNDCKGLVTQLATNLHNFPLYISQAGSIYRNSSSGAHDMASFSVKYLGNLNQIVRHDTVTYSKSLVPVPEIMSELEPSVISILCIFALCPSKLRTSVLINFIKLLLPEETEPENCLRTLETFGLVLVEINETKTATMHSLYQMEVFNCLAELGLQKSFLQKLAAALNTSLGGPNLLPGDDIHEYIRLVSSIWDLFDKGQDSIRDYLNIPLFLDDSCTQLYSKARYLGLGQMVNNVLSEHTSNSLLTENETAFVHLATRYIYNAAYCYMEFGKGIEVLLRTRQLKPDFCMKVTHNHAQFTGRVYVTALLSLIAFIVVLFTVPFTICPSSEAYSVVSWKDTVTISGLMALCILIPSVHVYILLTIWNPWIRLVLQYGFLASYGGCYVAFKRAQSHYRTDSCRASNDSIYDQVGHYLIVAALSFCFCHVAKPALAIILASCRFSRSTQKSVARMAWTILRNCHAECIHFLGAIIVLILVCWKDSESVVEGRKTAWIVYSVTGGIVGGVIFIYFVLMVPIFRSFISLSLWCSHKYNSLTD